MQRAGATTLAIRDRLRALGLDDEAVALLLAALGARSADAPAPEAEWAPTPAPVTAALPSQRETPAAAAPGLPITCTRCGVFVTATTTELILGKGYCEACAKRPEVNYPRAYRDAHWGKRDGWAWFFGVLSPFVMLAGVLALVNGDPAAGALVTFTGISWATFWTGARLGRVALVASTILGAVYNVSISIPPNVIGIGMVAMAMMSTRTKLFFEIDVPEAELAKAWLGQHANRAASWARGFGIVVLLSFLAWLGTRWAASATVFFGVLGVGFGVAGLRAVNETAQPPVGGRSSALVGIACGAIGVLLGPVGLLFAAKVL